MTIEEPPAEPGPVYQPVYTPTSGNWYPGTPFPGAGYPVRNPPRPSSRRRPRVAVVVGLAVGVFILIQIVLQYVVLTRLAYPIAKPQVPYVAAPTYAPFSGDLHELLLTPPKGSRPWNKPLSPDGNVDLQLAASNFTDPAAAANALQDYQFERGVVAQWVETDGTGVTIKIYQFATPAGSHLWEAFNYDGYVSDPTRTMQPGVAGEANDMFVNKTPDTNGYVATYAFAAKSDLYMIVTVAQLSQQYMPPIDAILQAQYARLP
jgi:hypothetical protein